MKIDRTILNVIFLTLLVLTESLQLLIALVLVFSYIPIPVSPMVHDLFPRQLPLVVPKRDLGFYHVFVLAMIAGQTALLVSLRQKLDAADLIDKLRGFFFVELWWLFLMVFAVFKFFVYGAAPWAMHLLWFSIGGAILSKLFWKELCAVSGKISSFLSGRPEMAARIADIAFPLLIILLLFVPDLEAVIARMWIGDSLHHMDSTLMGQAWAFSNGAKLNVDIYAHYGLGMPIFITLASKLFGRLSYEGVEWVLIIGTTAYFIACYFFLKRWLKNTWIAMAGILLAIKWQIFNPGNYPFIFTYPYSTVIRFGFDIIALFFILAHIRRGNFSYLIGAAIVCGTALFHVSDTGVYLLLAYIFYLAWLGLEAVILEKKSWKTIVRPTAACLGVVWLSACCWFFIFQGTAMFTRSFWAHMSERVELFMIGHGNLPMYKSLLEGDYLSSAMGFVFPLLYGGVLLVVVTLCILKKIDRSKIMAAVLCVYGLGLYHYYVPRSANNVYYTVCIPFVFVICWLAQEYLQKLKPKTAAILTAALLGLSAFALLTNQFYLSYPNIFNRSANPIVASTIKPVVKGLDYYFNNIPRSMPEGFKLETNSLGEKDEELKIESDFKSDAELKEFYNKEFAFNEDAALIDRLTRPGDQVPVISSFETRILMQADRKPFFYYFPLIDSRPMHVRMFPFTSLWTSSRLSVTLRQLDEQKPPYIFMEKILLARQVPASYRYLYPELIGILDYLQVNHYEPYQYGHFLVALKRMGGS